ncbi:MAG: MetS family NSS transporter small subunit [Arcanobacterium sp.]|nr:MetS family NSS transporter small subunit [Arcanobacterium sp.]
MTATATVMLIVSLLTVWGGLVGSVTYLMTHPLSEESEN